MKAFVKNAVGMIIAVSLCSAITVASSLGMFSKIEKNFYEPACLKTIQDRLDSVAEISNEYISNILEKTGPEEGFMSVEAVSSYFEREPSREVGRLLGKLFDDLKGLDGLRVVDQEGKRLQFSSYRNDSKNIKGNKTYFNYNELRTYTGNSELPFNIVSAFSADESGQEDSEEPVRGNVKENEKKYRLIFDGNEQRIIISFPYYYNDKEYSFIFYINPIDLANTLAERRIISINDYLTLISSADGSLGGFIFNMPHVGRSLLVNEILKRWKARSCGPDEIASTSRVKMYGVTEGKSADQTPDSDQTFVSWNLITSHVSKYIRVGGLYSAEMLTLPLYVRILLLICSGITVCLIIVIFFNLRKDDDIVILSKIKAVQVGLLNEYFEKSMDKAKVAALLESQKENLTQKIKKSLGRRGKKYGEDLDIVLNQSWQDIINILSGDNSGRINRLSSTDMTEIRRMFQDIVSNSSLRVQAVTQFPSRQPPKEKHSLESIGVELATKEYADELEATDVEPIEELDGAPADLEPVEELDAAPADLEPAEELEEAPADLEPAEELDAAPADLEPVEELDAAPADLEPAEELEGAPADLEPVEELEEAPAELELVEKNTESIQLDNESAKDSSTPEDDEVIEELEFAGPEQSVGKSTDTVSQNIDKLAEMDSILKNPSYESGEIETTGLIENSEFIKELESRDYVKNPDVLIPESDIRNKVSKTDDLKSDKELIEEAELLEEIEISSFEDSSKSIIFTSPRNEISQFEGTEPLVLGDSLASKEDDHVDNSVADNFVVYNTLNVILEENSDAEKPNSKTEKDSEDQKKGRTGLL